MSTKAKARTKKEVPKKPAARKGKTTKASDKVEPSLTTSQAERLYRMRELLDRLVSEGAEEKAISAQKSRIASMEEELGLEPGQHVAGPSAEDTQAAGMAQAQDYAEGDDVEEEVGTDEGDEPEPATSKTQATTKPRSTPKAKGGGSPQCLCGCGADNRPGSNFQMGHDAKLKSIILKRKRGDIKKYPEFVQKNLAKIKKLPKFADLLDV